MKKLFKKTKWIHKWFGLLLILFLMWMSASGILLNHPEWISGLSVPSWLVPPQYTPENWNRSSLIDLAWSESNPDIMYAAGKQGIWRSNDGAKSFIKYEKGFEDSWYYKKTKDLFLAADEPSFLLAATDGGLYVCTTQTGEWKPVPLGKEREAAKKILAIGETLMAFTESNVYEAQGRYPDFQFTKINWMREEPERRVTLVDLFFHLHDGRIWGLPGKLLFDFAGIIIIFLSISAFYIWFFPNHIKKLKQKRKTVNVRQKSKWYRILYKYHLKLGIWLAVIILIIGGTGFFMRPPVLALIAEGSVPASMYPGFLPDNPWHKKVHNALYDAVENKIIINCTDGTWQGPADFSEPFVKRDLDVPIFVMGATVFEPFGSGGYMVGSFNGLYHLERESGKAFDWIEKNYVSEWSNVRPADLMVTGYFKTADGREFITAHEQGLLTLAGEKPGDRFVMPAQIKSGFRIPLWNFMFELHNGRIFKDWIGGLYILLVPLGSLLFVLITISGIYDWLVLWYLKRKTRIRG